MRCVLVGAVESSRLALDALIAAGCAPALVITVPTTKAAMHSDYVDIGVIAEAHGIAVERTLDVNAPDILAKIAALAPDIIFVIGWSRLCGADFRSAAGIGVIGYHPTDLPRMRGRAALAWTILLDCRETAGSLFWIDEGTDTGAIAAQHRFDLPARVDLPTLYALHMQALRTMLDSLIPKLARGEVPAVPQDHGAATFLAHRTASDGAIDWTQSADVIDRLVRAVTRPYPGAFTSLKGERLTIWACEPVDRPEWYAQIGQVFTVEDGHPIVRCGCGGSLKVTSFELERGDGVVVSTLRGQPRLGT